jgi:hypothetical protein
MEGADRRGDAMDLTQEERPPRDPMPITVDRGVCLGPEAQAPWRLAQAREYQNGTGRT